MRCNHPLPVILAATIFLHGCASQPAAGNGALGSTDRASQLASIIAAGSAIEAAQNAPYDPVAFEAQLAKARQPFDKCVDDRIPEFKAKPIADKTVAARLLLGECGSKFQPVSDLLHASPLAKRPEEERAVVDRVLNDAQKRAETAFLAP